MTISLLREPLGSAFESERVLELPKFVRSGGGTYWHIPRSASRHEDGRLVVSLWCGVTFGSVRSKPVVLTDIEPAENICGTCTGRWEGAQTDGPLIFTPRDEFAIPAWCPCDESDDDCLCLACGHRIRYSWSHGPGRHRPGALFAERCQPCPDHGWSRAGTQAGRVVCFAWVGGDWEGNCGFDCGPIT